jgi:hypothetical protein
MKLTKPYIENLFIFLILIMMGLFLILLNYFDIIFFLEKSTEKTGSDIKVDSEAPKSVFQPPEIVKAIYLTSWSAAKEDKINYVIDIAKNTEINSVVIDIKDFSGYVSYNTAVPDVKKYKAESLRIKDIVSLIEKFHEERIYVIGRITVFQDPVLAHVRPDLAIHSKSKISTSTIPTSTPPFLSVSTLWLDDVELAWIDPAARTAWDYNIAIAKDALGQGFDEINFDYVRFPSDGDLEDMSFSSWDEKTPKNLVIKGFFKCLREELLDAKLSIDLFGLSTVSSNDLGVGQVIEDAFEYFDYICPMVYPSHYETGFLNHQNPADYPYEVVKHSIEGALTRLSNYNQLKRNVQLRPWLQDFDLGAIYDAEMVKSEIKAVHDASGDNFKGFMLWNSLNIYTKEALRPAY